MSKEKSKEYVVLQSIVGSKSVSFHPDFARALGSVPAGLFLSQGFFWQFNAQHIERITIEGKQYFSRTISDWETETALSEEQQKGARAILIKAGILTEKKAGLPARLYYSFDFDALVAVIYGYKETGKQVSEDNRSKKRYLPRTSSGKIRRQEAVKYGDNYKERDFNETLESLERGAQAPNSHPQPFEKFELFELFEQFKQFEEEKKEKNTPPNSAPPPLKKEPRDLLLDWSNEQLQTIQAWYERAYRKFSQQDLESRVDDFLAVYVTHENYGIRVQVEQDPLKFFKGRFQLFLKNQDKFERPKQGEKAKSRILDTPNRNYEREPLF